MLELVDGGPPLLKILCQLVLVLLLQLESIKMWSDRIGILEDFGTYADILLCCSLVLDGFFMVMLSLVQTCGCFVFLLDCLVKVMLGLVGILALSQVS